MSEIGLHYSEAGAGLPLVLIHGFPFDGSIWAAQEGGLRDVARVLVPDLPGFGQSPPLPGPAAATQIADYARALLAWADGLRIAAFAVAGHSMGGYIALALARLAPLRLAGLILVASRAGADSPEGVAKRRQAAADVAARGPVATVDAMLEKLLAPGPPDPAIYNRVRSTMLAQAPAGIIPALYAMAARPDSISLLATIQTPALLIAGAQDRTIPPTESQTMRDHLRNAAYVEIPGAGHLPMLEVPAAVNAALRPFVAGLLPPLPMPRGT